MPDSDSKNVRELVAEWWEVWHMKPRAAPLIVPAYGHPVDTRIPLHGHPSRDCAREQMRREKNRYLKLKHVRRYRVL